MIKLCLTQNESNDSIYTLPLSSSIKLYPSIVTYPGGNLFIFYQCDNVLPISIKENYTIRVYYNSGGEFLNRILFNDSDVKVKPFAVLGTDGNIYLTYTNQTKNNVCIVKIKIFRYYLDL